MLAKQLFTTIWNYRAYNRLLERPQHLPITGESIRVELKSLHPWTKGSTKGYSRHTMIARLSALGYIAEGVGASNLYGEAIQKAISEAYERLTYFILRGACDFKTSSGFAAHPNLHSAIQNASLEALERDAVLVHWLTKTPLLALPLNDEANENIAIENSLAGTPFSAKHLLLSTRGWISTLTLIAEERWGGGAIVAHGSGHSLEHAFHRTLVELERQAAVARDLLPRNPGFKNKIDRIFDHCTFSRERLEHASWLRGKSISWTEASRAWRPLTQTEQARLCIHHIAADSVHVVRASGPHLQELYFGETKRETVNLARVENQELNLDPHFVA